MMIQGPQGPSILGLLIADRAPSFDILGSFFPAWLFCMALALLLTLATHWLLLRVRMPLALPLLSYPSLTGLFTFALWLFFFR